MKLKKEKEWEPVMGQKLHGGNFLVGKNFGVVRKNRVIIDGSAKI